MDNIRCRSCRTDISEVFYHPINVVGYESLTLKYMFETAVGFPIQKWEPQQFCDICAQRLIDWHEYKSMCKNTQDSLTSVKMEPPVNLQEDSVSTGIKLEPEEPVDLEEDSVSKDVKLEPKEQLDELSVSQGGSQVKEEKDVMANSEEDEPVESNELTLTAHHTLRQSQQTIDITFEAYIRYYKEEKISEKSFIGLFPISTVGQRTLFDFKTQLWMEIKGHLIREVIFTEDRKPLWSVSKSPSIGDMGQFVEFSFAYSSYTLDVIKSSNLTNWHNKQVILYIFPYSTAIKTKDEWIDVTNRLFQFKKRPEKKLKTHHKKDDCQEVKDEEIPDPPETITFKGFMRNYIGEPLNSAKSLGPIKFVAQSKSDLKQKLWDFINSLIITKRVNFQDDKFPFAENFPSFHDVDKFFEFKLKNSLQKPTMNNITAACLEDWQTRDDVQLYIYPYTTAITTEAEYQEITSKLAVDIDMDKRITKALMHNINSIDLERKLYKVRLTSGKN